jgi:outer membrane immunogenic protein
MKKILLASTSFAVLLSAGVADAADLAPQYVKAAPVPVYSWTGFYLGLHAGGASLDEDLSAVASFPGQFDNRFTDTYHKLGFLGGGQVGYNWQTGMTVVGVEADGAWTNLKVSTDTTNDPFFFGKGGTARLSTNIDWLVTLRARAGIAATPSLLLYVTGGAAAAGVKISYQNAGGVFGGPLVNTVTANNTIFGWTAGVGAEYALSHNWTVKGEYLRVQFDNSTLNLATIPNGFAGVTGRVRVSPDLDIFRLGVNYKL